jgi:hypothetical protein
MGDAGGLVERIVGRSRLEAKCRPKPQTIQRPCFGTSVLVLSGVSPQLEPGMATLQLDTFISTP